MGQALDITTLIRPRSADNPADGKFGLAVEACPDGMVMTDGVGTIVLVNAEAERLFGYARGELIGRPMEILLPARLRGEYCKRRAMSVLRAQTPHCGDGCDLAGLRRDGTEFPVEIRLNPIHTGDGLFVLGVIVDIGERQRMDRLKDEFVATVSHELRTPLTSISGSLGLLVSGAAGELPDAALRLLGIAQRNSNRLVRLINDILDIEKIESGQAFFNFKRVEVRALAEEVIEANRAYADGFGVCVRLDPQSDACEVAADADRLAQVLTNLLSNAVKFSPRGGEVAVATAQRGGTVRISVRDHGAGIPAEFKPRVFEKFAQADAGDARQKGGTGLGLSIVRQIVARLNGKVGFHDAEGGGTVFFVDLPGSAQIAGSEIDAERT
jgi:PAS domain S-box-containing protein